VHGTFWGSDKCFLCALPFLLSSNRLFFFKQRNHINMLIFPINSFLEQLTPRCHNIILSTCATLEVLDKHRKVQDSSLKWLWQYRQYMRPGGSHFILESSASFWWIKNETKHLPFPILGYHRKLIRPNFREVRRNVLMLLHCLKTNYNVC